MLGLNSELESSCLPEQLRYIIHLSHAFECDAVVLPLRPIANRFGGCFCLGSGPVFVFWFVFGCLLRCFRWRNASLAGGFAGRRFWCVFFVCCLIDLLILRTFLSLYSVLTAYSHVRTEPQCDIGQTRGKKKMFVLFGVVFCVLACFVSFCVLIVTAYRTMYRSSTSLLVRPLYRNGRRMT